MANIWVISDTHFNHANILKFEDKLGKPCRVFSGVDEMNETMIANWNSVVKPQDKVYHLGDVLFGLDKPAWLDANFKRLNGKKRLIVGNHDNIKLLSQWFSEVMLWRDFSEFGLLLTHVPVHQSTLKENHRFGDGSMVNVHGHIHQNASPDGPYKCVCVEQTNYTPVNIDELRTN
jgi:calcineurin-like phosphoesterase family protein